MAEPKREDAKFCKFCWLEDNERPESPLITACNCIGTNANVHRKCLMQWIEARGREKCEICHQNYSIGFTKVEKGFWSWIKSEDKSFVLTTLLTIITALAFTSTFCYFTALKVRTYHSCCVKKNPCFEKGNFCWLFPVTGVLVLILFSSFIAITISCVSAHYREWKERNFDITFASS